MKGLVAEKRKKWSNEKRPFSDYWLRYDGRDLRLKQNPIPDDLVGGIAKQHEENAKGV